MSMTLVALVSLLIGALVGYLAGRSAGLREGARTMMESINALVAKQREGDSRKIEALQRKIGLLSDDGTRTVGEDKIPLRGGVLRQESPPLLLCTPLGSQGEAGEHLDFQYGTGARDVLLRDDDVDDLVIEIDPGPLR